MRRILISTLLALAWFTSSSQSKVVNLNDNWQFYYNWQLGRGEGMGVDLPHGYNYDAMYRADYFRGLVGYLKYIDVPMDWKFKAVNIKFDGVGTVADLYVNGSHVGQHRGGYTVFGWNISQFLKPGQRNTLHLRVNNAPWLDMLPLESPCNQWGGVYSNVSLRVTPNCYIGQMETGGCGLRIKTINPSVESATINASAKINGLPESVVNVVFKLFDGSGLAMDSVSRVVEIPMSGSVDVIGDFQMIKPRLWNGKKDPYLYNMSVTASSKGGSDVVSSDFGVRSFGVDARNQFLLNGQPLKVRGVVVHHEWEGVGNVFVRQNFERDMAWILEIGANAVRVYGRPVDDYFATLCDKNGVMVWSEMPLTAPYAENRNSAYNRSDELDQNAQQVMHEMITQGYNHPSIIWWGLFSDISQRGDDPIALVRDLQRIAAEQDPQRLTIAASSQDGALNMVTDMIGFNPWFGWNAGMPTDISIWSEQLRKDWSKLKAGVSAYGAGGHVYQNTDTLYRPIVESNFHPQQWQSHLLEIYLREIEAPTSGLWGGFVMSMFDFASPYARKYPRPGINDCGLVNYNRTQAKEAFYLYKAAWNEVDKFIYPAIPINYGTKGYTIKVYSNYPKIELLVNGVSMGVKDNDGIGVFSFNNLALKKDSGQRIEMRVPGEEVSLEILAYDLMYK